MSFAPGRPVRCVCFFNFCVLRFGFFAGFEYASGGILAVSIFMSEHSTSSSLSPSQEFEERKRKLQDLRDAKISPYPERFERTHLTREARDFAEKNPPRPLEDILNGPKNEVSLAGRLMLMRPHGKLTFGQIQDAGGRLQICFMQDFLGVDAYKMLKKIDMADFLSVKGELFLTKHGEITVLVKEYQLLSKALRPLPEKFHGLKDTESQYRYRYLDMLSNPQTYERFIVRSKLISALRKFLDSHNFLEIETPILNTIASGAMAKPFVTHHNALDFDVFLRIAPETYLKRAVVGGLERVYEFAKCFRNEGIDPSHLQEFTMLEFYGSYWNFEDNMNFTENMIVEAIKEVNGGSLQVKCLDRDGKEQLIDFAAPWPRVQFGELIRQDCGIDILEYYNDAPGLLKAIKDKGIKLEKAEGLGYGNLCDALYKKVSRPNLIQPMFVIKHPVDTKPLARRNDDDPRLADTFQLLVNTWEIVNAYSELVDPLDQRERLVNQASAKAGGDDEAMPMDEDYLLSMEHGMPPMSGFGMGIDRLMALLSQQDNLKDVVLFPLMKPQE